MAVRKAQAALVGVDRRESSRVMEQVVRFLDDPPEVFVVVTGIVIGDGRIVEVRRIDGVAVEVPDGAIDIAIEAEVGMTMHIAAEDAQGLAAGRYTFCPYPDHLLGFFGVGGLGRILLGRCRSQRRLAARNARNTGSVYFVLDERIRLGKGAAVTGPDHRQPAAGSGGDGRAQIVSPERERQRDRLRRRRTREIEHRIIPQRILLRAVALQRLAPDLMQLDVAAAHEAPDVAVSIGDDLRLFEKAGRRVGHEDFGPGQHRQARAAG